MHSLLLLKSTKPSFPGWMSNLTLQNDSDSVYVLYNAHAFKYNAYTLK